MTTRSDNSAPITTSLKGHTCELGDEDLQDSLRGQVEIGLDVYGADAARIPCCDLGSCVECGAYLCGTLLLEGGAWRFELSERRAPCEFPAGMQPYHTFIDVPSGVLVLGGDLRTAFPEVPHALGFNINRSVGQREHNQAYAAVGMGYMMAQGYNNKASKHHDSVLIGYEPYRQAENDEDDGVDLPLPGKPQGRIGSNGLRAVCAADLDLYEAQCRKHGLLGDGIAEQIAQMRKHFASSSLPLELDGDDYDRLGTLAVKVRPGRYRITHNYFIHNLRGEQPENGSEIFARIDPA